MRDFLVYLLRVYRFELKGFPEFPRADMCKQRLVGVETSGGFGIGLCFRGW